MQLHTRGRAVVALLGAALAAPVIQVLPAAAAPSGTPDVVFVEAGSDFAALQLRATDGSRTVNLTTRDTGVFDRAPDISPDRSSIVFESNRLDPAGGLLLIGSDGTGLRRLTVNDPSQGQEDTDPSFVPGSDEVVFTRTDAVGNQAIYRKPVGAASVATALNYQGSAPDVNANGKVVFSDAGGNLMTGTLAGDAPVSLGVRGSEPTWSPDGTEIAYVGDDAPVVAAGNRSRLHVVAADGSSERELAVADAGGTYVVGYPQWLPDGQSLVYDSVSADSAAGDRLESRLYAVDRLGTRAGRVFEPIGSIDQYEGDVQGPAPTGVVMGSADASYFVPVEPTRIFDSREDEPAPGPKGPVGPAGTVDVQVTGVGGVPANATAAVLNVTAVGGTATTYVTAYPTGSPVPDTSTSNPVAGADVPNLATVRIGTGGQVSLYNNLGSVDLVVDLAGYYLRLPDAGSGGSGFTAVNPTRVYDSRPDELPATGPKTRLQAGGTVDVAVTGVAGVPGDASAVVVNLTGVGPTASTFLTAYPKPGSGSAFPSVSNLNVLPGGDAANVAVVPVGADGSIRLRNGLGEVDVVVDIAGYYETQSGAAFVPVDPSRFLDTRTGLGSAPTRLAAEGFLDLRVADYRGIPSQVTAVVGNLTGVAPSVQTTLRAYGPGPDLPTVSNLNLRLDEVRANAVYLPADANGLVRLYNDRGLVNVVTDVSGFFLPVGP